MAFSGVGRFYSQALGGRPYIDFRPTGKLGFYFEMLIFTLIFLTVGVGVLETVDSLNCDGTMGSSATCHVFQVIEWIAVVIFTIEYAFRFMAAPQVRNLELCKKELEWERAKLTKSTDDDDALNSEGDCCPEWLRYG